MEITDLQAPSDQAQSCRPLTVRDLIHLAARPVTSNPAPEFAVAAMVMAALRVMIKPGSGRYETFAEAVAVLVSAPVPIIAQALIAIIKRERTFSISVFVADVNALVSALQPDDQDRVDVSEELPTAP